MTLKRSELPINSTADVERARHLVRAFAQEAGLPDWDVEELVLATTELTKNILKHANSRGSLLCSPVEVDGEHFVEIKIKDSGPGIADIGLAMQEGYSSGSGLGSGLPTAKRHVDKFVIESSTEGTTIRLAKRIRLK